MKLVRENLKAMCLAIGDGANDVSMLQMADVGVGIVGNEGMQAVMASDFVIGRFKFLKRLLLLHGHWCYDRLARMIVYFFYKNAVSQSFLDYSYQLTNSANFVLFQLILYLVVDTFKQRIGSFLVEFTKTRPESLSPGRQRSSCFFLQPAAISVRRKIP